jgi:hypothetical protein
MSTTPERKKTMKELLILGIVTTLSMFVPGIFFVATETIVSLEYLESHKTLFIFALPLMSIIISLVGLRKDRDKWKSAFFGAVTSFIFALFIGS